MASGARLQLTCRGLTSRGLTSRRLQCRLALAVALALLAGCAQVPVHGPVVEGPSAGPGGGSDVSIEAQKPQRGATQIEIAQGFLDAMSTYEVGFPLAKEFLTDAAEDAWSMSPVVVYDTPAIEIRDDGIVHLSAQRVADIDAAGQYTAAGPLPPLDIPMPMVRVGGELRISTPPPGLFITTLDRDNDYSFYLTYYPSRSADVLVPDVVWLPGSGPALATVLVQALVDGPTTRLGESVRNPFPEGTTVSAVTVRAGGVAAVALSSEVATASPADQQLMAAQLAYTLLGVPPEVQEVTMTVGGEPFDVPGVVDVLSPGVFPDQDPLLGWRAPAAYALVSDRLVSIDPATGISSRVPGTLGDTAAGATSVAISLQESVAAVVSANGRSVTTHHLADGVEPPPPQSFTGVDIAPPSFDRFGDLWVVDRTSPGRSTVYVIAPDGTGAGDPIVAPALDGVHVISLKVAPDGARVAVSVLLEDGTTRLLFLRVVRGDVVAGAQPVPDAPRVTLTGVADPPLLPGLEDIGDLAWFSGTEIAVIGSARDRRQPAIVRIDGSALTPEVETGALTVAAFPQQPLFVVSEDTTLRREVSAITWETLGPGDAVTYPG